MKKQTKSEKYLNELIPDTKNFQNLLEMDIGEEAIVQSVRNQRLAGPLAALGVIPGTQITVLRKRKNDPILIWARKTRIALAQNIAKNIFIKRGNAA